MTNNNHDNRQDLDRKLERLVKLASESTVEPIAFPSDEEIEAYIFGNATERQEQSVLNALEHSSSFRRELSEIMDDLQPVIEITESSRVDAESEERTGSGHSKSSSFHSLWGSIKKSFSVRVLVPAVAVAIVALLILWPSDQQILSWNLVSESVDPGELISIQLKGTSGQKAIGHYATSKEAAFGAFRQLLTLGSDGIMIDPQHENPDNSGHEALTQLILLDEGKKSLSHYKVNLSHSPGGFDSSVQAWLLLLPSRNVMQLSMTTDSVHSILPIDSDRYGCLTITVQSDSGWTFTPPASFGYPDNALR